jgi:hypothetical protein
MAKRCPHLYKGEGMGKILDLTSRACPYCAETIKRRAVICRFCGYDLRTSAPTRPTLAALQEAGEEGQTRGDRTEGGTLGCGLFLVLTLLFLGGLVCLFFLLGSAR